MRVSIAVGLALFCCLPALAAVEFCVAPTGEDDAPGTQELPFATVERALEETRKTTGPRRILVQPGTYYLSTTLTLGPQDSDLTIWAEPAQPAVLSGGRLVRDFKPWRGAILQADLSTLGLPDLASRELYYRGQRQPLARTPNLDPQHPRHGGFLYNARVVEAGSTTKLAYREGELDPAHWIHPERALVTSYCSANASYENCVSRVVKIEAEQRTLELDHGVYAFEAGDRYYVSNLIEALDAPGEWVVDPDAKTLYFWPPEGTLQGDVVVPALDSLVVIQGDTKGGPLVTGVRLTGLALSDCRGAAVKLTGARDCAVTACDVRNVDIAVHLSDETHACRVAGCDITQTGQEPIRLWGEPTAHERVSHHVIDNNYIHDFGYGDYHNAHAGVVLWSVAHCQVTRNHIHDGPRFGVSYNGGNDNVIAYNHIHHMNSETCDTGLIYTVTSVDWGKPDEQARRATNLGNEIHHNLLHDAGGYGRDSANRFEYPHYSWGIYLDLASSGWSVHDNVVYNTTLGGYHVNGGSSNVCENNILVNAQRTQCRVGPWPKYEMNGNRFEGNIVANLAPGAALYDLGAWKPEYVTFDRNLVYGGGESPRIRAAAVRGPLRECWAKWQALGQDKASLVADPLFAAPDRQDYALQKDSPALKIGFRPIDLSGVGNYASPERRTWPRPEVPVHREPADYSPRREAAAQPARRDYEDYAVGDGEHGAAIGEEGTAGTVRVTDATAAAGSKHSLKFTDAAGLKHAFVPYAAYVWEVDEGLLHGGFDLRWETGADFVYEWRDDPAVYSLGPNLRVDPEGFLAANGKRLLQLAAGQWVRFDVTCGIGAQATGKYDLTVKLTGGEPQVFKGLACNPKFLSLEQFVIMSNTNGPSVFYVDNLEIDAIPAK
jgi:hypothetical protein